MLIDGTKNATGSFVSNGAIALTGTGTLKTGLHLGGAGFFKGPVTLDGSSAVNIAGDQSTGILVDNGFLLNGDLTLGGNFAMAASTVNASTSSQIALAHLLGTIKGNVIVSAAGSYTGAGNGASGFTISGPIQHCDITVTPGCTELGTFANSGSIVVLGVATRSVTGVNAERDPRWRSRLARWDDQCNS